MHTQLELGLEDDTPSRDRSRLMQAVDVVSDRLGKGTLRVGSTKPKRAAQGAWEAKLERRTPAYTTERKAMPVVRCCAPESTTGGARTGGLRGDA